MDSDEYDDIADEDLAEALTQSENFGGSFTSGIATLPSGGGRVAPSAQPSLAEFDDLPTDAFSSSAEPEPVATLGRSIATHNPQQGVSKRGSGIYRQTTLFGETLEPTPGDLPPAPGLGRAYRGDKPDVPTQHVLDEEALKTWVYPMNLGAIRDYQYSIVKSGLFSNTLVALPTGLGKTFIAATIMLNYYRWTKSAKIIFVAPTKPLVSQQVDACFNIVGISRSETTMLTGECAPALRADEWQSKRVFFMTPQTLLNDISRGYADPKSIVLLVIDEAHRATGEYAYAKVTKLIRRFNPHFRVLALTATPGSKIETVQEVMDNLGICHTEIRTEDSMDIRQYVHARNIDQRILDPSDEMCEIKALFTKALKPLMDKLSEQNIYYGRDPMSITTFGLMQQSKEWFQSTGRNKPQGLQHMMRAIFSILMGLAHAIKLLNYHGIKPFYDKLNEFRGDVERAKGKGSKYKSQITADTSFQEMMDRIESWMRIPDFVGHPKLTELAQTIMNHFLDAEARGETTRAIVFSEYRDSAEEIVRALNIHRPMIKATVFVGQADAKGSAGMKQSEQIERVEQFKNGIHNVLVATSIGEEGLDIGQVDLIVCYDASASPIRMLQRMGRTGRKREGHVVLLLMKGREEDNFAKARDNYEGMQKLICEGSKFNFRHDLSPRILPKVSRPEVDKRFIEIPIENTQNTGLPEPRKRKAAARTKKAPPKKFHMPDGVETGFMKASDLGKKPSATKRGRPKAPTPPEPTELDELAELPPSESVLLSTKETAELDHLYRSLPVTSVDVQETELPSLTAYPHLQRSLRPIGKVKHGRRTKKYVSLMQRLADNYRNPRDSWVYPHGEEDNSRWRELPVPVFASDTDAAREGSHHLTKLLPVDVSDDEPPEGRPQPKKRKTNPAPPRQPIVPVSETEEECLPPVRRPGQKPKASKAKRRKAVPKKGRGINSDELGDDCERESDMLDSDGSDSGGDLVDFIVGDDQPISSIRASSTLDSSPMSTPMPARSRDVALGKAQPFYVPTQFPGTQESLDELPDIDDMLPTNGVARQQRSHPTVIVESDTAGSGTALEDDSEDGIVPRNQQRRRRAVVAESESDE